MRRITILQIALFGCLTLVAPVGATDADDESAVRDAVARATRLVTACDMDDYEREWHKDATIFISSGDPLMPISTYLETWRGVCAAGGGIVIEDQQMEIDVHGDIALSTGTMDYSFKGPDGSTHSGTNRFTTVLKKESGSWKMIHAHGSELGAHTVHED